jgi:MFS transporter, PHS family, inorganic phosphate transporter
MSATSSASASPFQQLDEDAPNQKFQMKIMFTAGMGFFTDAYDLFIIGVVVDILKTQWNLSSDQTALLSASTLIASAVGALVFGRIADIVGRKKMYGVEILILAIGAIASAFAPDLTWLIIFRAILGIGVGGDYPVSATIMSEYSSTKSRGKMVGLVFAMQAAGYIVGPLIAVLLLSIGIKDDIVWRILLGLGAVPGLAVFWLRRQIRETPRFAMAGGEAAEAQAAILNATSGGEPTPPTESNARINQSITGGWRTLFSNPTLLKWLIGAALCWGLLDFAYYGNTIASPQIVGLMNPNFSITQSVLVTLAIFVVFAAPGYFVAIRFLDTMGRKKIQSMGFAIMTITYLMIALIPSVSVNVVPFVVIFGVSYFFTEFGPNTTTFVYPAEIFPTEVRTTAHGICAAMGKLGGCVGVYLLQLQLDSWGIRTIEGICAGVALAGLLLTIALLPEPMGKSLEELEAEADFKPTVFAPATAPSPA